MRSPLTIILLALSVLSFGQEPADCDYRAPLDIELVLSGTFGELRTNHFHSGIDIKTQGRTGLPIYAIGDGYISRIKVSPGGFGKAIYIRHPEGFTSVYAHLDGFSEEIQTYVLNEQYKRESFSVDLYPNPNKFPLKKGQIIAQSGNSGSSAAPHLHFEIRNSANEFPMNPLLFGIDIPDHRAPVLTYLVVEPMDIFSRVDGSGETKFYPLYPKTDGSYHLMRPNIEVFGKVGFAIANYDQLDGAENKNGSYSIEMFIDGKKTYGHEVKSFGFHETRFINSHITYDMYNCCRIKAQKCYLDPYNQLSMTKGNVSAAFFTERGYQDLEIRVSDFAGNTTFVRTKISVTEANEEAWTQNEGVPVQWDKINSFKENGFDFYAGLGTFYKDHHVTIDGEAPLVWGENTEFTLGDDGIAMHKNAEIGFELQGVDPLLMDKVVIMRRERNSSSVLDGSLTGSQFSFRTRQLGKFELHLDTIAPRISAHQWKKSFDLSRDKGFTFFISDDLSGIDSYKATVDGAWILMEYDPKTKRLSHKFDGHIGTGAHELVLKVWDEKGNLSEQRLSFNCVSQ